jgi:hypothetical protein
MSISFYTNAQGKVVFNEPSNVSRIMSDYIEKNKSQQTLMGWKIQIISTSDRREMDAVREKFNALFPSMPNSWKHVVPNYQVRVGAFRSKEELLNRLYEIKKEFPASIAVQDQINKIDLINF